MDKVGSHNQCVCALLALLINSCYKLRYILTIKSSYIIRQSAKYTFLYIQHAFFVFLLLHSSFFVQIDPEQNSKIHRETREQQKSCFVSMMVEVINIPTWIKCYLNGICKTISLLINAIVIFIMYRTLNRLKDAIVSQIKRWIHFHTIRSCMAWVLVMTWDVLIFVCDWKCIKMVRVQRITRI